MNSKIFSRDVVIKRELCQASNILDNFINKSSNIAAIDKGAAIMTAAIKSGNKIISCGNGGSMSDAMHFASELTGRYRADRDPIAAVAISDPGHLSCVANDYGYEHVFSRYVEAHGKEGDVLFALSTSGKSKNVMNAIYMAIANGMHVVFLTGNIEGDIISSNYINLLEKKSAMINIPHSGSADRIQEVSIVVIHILCKLIEENL